jgi:farnesyl diphosphate synthase
MQKNVPNNDFSRWQIDCQERTKKNLQDNLSNAQLATKLFEAVSYSLLSPGKRLRPSLVYASGELLAIDIAILDKLSAVIEAIHVYSLIHDDLPAMDDDDLRRGKPSCHKAFDEATAILAGDALQVLAFEWLCEIPLKAEIIVQLCSALSKAIGINGMAQGQALDMYWAKQSTQPPTIDDVQEIHHLKTGKLFSACIEMCLIVSQQTKYSMLLKKFSHHIGIAFQIQDDILDITGDQTLIGKTVGSDQQANKLTYPALIGLDASYQQRNHHYEQAIQCLKHIDSPTKRLIQLAQNMIYPEKKSA